jgi:hypothetical protein
MEFTLTVSRLRRRAELLQKLAPLKPRILDL